MKNKFKLILGFLIVFSSACTKEETIHPTACDGTCDTDYIVVYENQQILPNSNGHYEVDWNGLNYFQIKGQLTKLDSQYCSRDGVPFIQASFDSDYWVIFSNIFFQTPMYSYLGWFNSNTLNTPIPYGNHDYTLEDLLDVHPPYNIAGYQVPHMLCVECPYAPTLVGSHSKYTYQPTQNFLLDDEMIGDTINIFIETTFNTEGGIWYQGHDSPSPKEIITDEIKVIII